MGLLTFISEMVNMEADLHQGRFPPVIVPGQKNVPSVAR